MKKREWPTERKSRCPRSTAQKFAALKFPFVATRSMHQKCLAFRAYSACLRNKTQRKGARDTRQRPRMSRDTWKSAALLTLSFALWSLLRFSPRGSAVASEPEHPTLRRTSCDIQLYTWRRSFGHSWFRIHNWQEVLRSPCSFFVSSYCEAGDSFKSCETVLGN